MLLMLVAVSAEDSSHKYIISAAQWQQSIAVWSAVSSCLAMLLAAQSTIQCGQCAVLDAVSASSIAAARLVLLSLLSAMNALAH
jgi:hypothetical protein